MLGPRFFPLQANALQELTLHTSALAATFHPTPRFRGPRMRTAMPALAAQAFAGNVLVRGLGSRKLEALLASDQPQEFALVADRRIGVASPARQPPADGGGAVPAATAVHWLDRAGLAALDLTPDGDRLRLRNSSSDGAAAAGSTAAAAPAAAAGLGGQAGVAAEGAEMHVPVYFLGEDQQRRVLRLAVDVTGAPPGWTAARGVHLQASRAARQAWKGLFSRGRCLRLRACVACLAS